MAGRWRGMRVPLASINHGWVAKRRTRGALLEVIVWSLEALAYGAHPARRRDGGGWQPAGWRRQERAAEPFDFRG
eukprot:1143008-Lingulodinium_polyedra.AAC.1